MLLKTLKRTKRTPVKVSPETELSLDLQKRAQEVLGYSTGFHEVSNQNTYQQGLQLLMDACDATGCRYPFTQESVNKYQLIMAPTDASAFVKASLAVLGLIIGGITTFVGGLVLCASAGTDPVALLVLGTGLLMCAPWVWMMKYRRQYLWTRDQRRWTSDNLQNHHGPVPEFALQTACDLKEYLKQQNVSCAFEIVELDDRSTAQLDPFLRIIIPQGRYYLEVWNEPGYKQERVV